MNFYIITWEDFAPQTINAIFGNVPTWAIPVACVLIVFVICCIIVFKRGGK